MTKKPRFTLWGFIGKVLCYWLLYAVVWGIVFDDFGGLLATIGNGIALLLGLATATAQLYYKQNQYITQLQQETSRIANDIDVTRQHLQGLKRDYLPEHKEEQAGLVVQVHRYEDQLTQSKIAYNEAVKNYNEGIKLLPYSMVAHPKEKDYFSDFYI